MKGLVGTSPALSANRGSIRVFFTAVLPSAHNPKGDQGFLVPSLKNLPLKPPLPLTVSTPPFAREAWKKGVRGNEGMSPKRAGLRFKQSLSG